MEWHLLELECLQCGEKVYLYDKDLSNLEKYRPGMKGMFQVEIRVKEEYRTTTQIRVIRFAEKEIDETAYLSQKKLFLPS